MPYSDGLTMAITDCGRSAKHNHFVMLRLLALEFCRAVRFSHESRSERPPHRQWSFQIVREDLRYKLLYVSLITHRGLI